MTRLGRRRRTGWGGGFERPPGPQAAPGFGRRDAAGRSCPGPDQPAGSLLADEPTGTWIPSPAAQILALFSHLHRQWGKTIIL